MKTRTPKMTRRYAERKTKDMLPLWQSGAHLSSPRACRQTSTTWSQQDSCSTPCSAHLSFLQCGYTQRTGHTGFPQTHWWNWRGGAATYPILKSASLERIFYGVLSVHSCLSPSVESPPEYGVSCGRQTSGENMKCCVLFRDHNFALMIISTCSARNSTNWSCSLFRSFDWELTRISQVCSILDWTLTKFLDTLSLYSSRRDLQTLLCLTPGDFTRKRETPWVLKGWEFKEIKLFLEIE